MDIPFIYRDAEEFTQHLDSAQRRLLPVIEWIDHHEDPLAKAKVSTALLVILCRKAIARGVPYDRAIHFIKAMYAEAEDPGQDN